MISCQHKSFGMSLFASLCPRVTFMFIILLISFSFHFLWLWTKKDTLTLSIPNRYPVINLSFPSWRTTFKQLSFFSLTRETPFSSVLVVHNCCQINVIKALRWDRNNTRIWQEDPTVCSVVRVSSWSCLRRFFTTLPHHHHHHHSQAKRYQMKEETQRKTNSTFVSWWWEERLGRQSGCKHILGQRSLMVFVSSFMFCEDKLHGEKCIII